MTKNNIHERNRIEREALGKNPKCPVCKTLLAESMLVPYWLVCNKCKTISNPTFTFIKKLSNVKKYKKTKSRHKKIIEPYIVINKKKHPYGKPITAYFNDLRMWISVRYVGNIGKTKTNGVGIGNAKPEQITIFFDTKTEYGWMHMNVNDATRLASALTLLLKTNKKGYVKKTMSGIKITKYRRYIDKK